MWFARQPALADRPTNGASHKNRSLGTPSRRQHGVFSLNAQMLEQSRLIKANSY
jgi:hypothetical protein